MNLHKILYTPVLRNQARNIYEENKRWLNRFVSLEALTATDLAKFSSLDSYKVNSIFFAVLEYEIPIEDFFIAQALESLSKRQQDVILLSFFMDMKDVDIANLLNLSKSTIHHHKEYALEALRTYMEEHTYEE